MELPHYFRTTLDTIPANVPYLQVEPQHVTDSGKLNIGLVWKAGGWDERRDIPFNHFEALNKLEDVTFLILQANAQEAGWHTGFGINPGTFSLYEYAQVMKSLDLLITIDSMPAHLAGALGVPVWTLLHAQADWRWMDNRTDSPWYPSMRLFRQEQQGEWAPVMEAVKQELSMIYPGDK